MPDSIDDFLNVISRRHNHGGGAVRRGYSIFAVKFAVKTV
jgi:hypothetical protein